MPDQTATYVQLASIIVYVFTIFGLYKLLTSQKDATIQAKDAQIELLKLQLEQSEANTPDVLVSSLSARINTVIDELSRLETDNQINTQEVTKKKKELETAHQELEILRAQITRADELLDSFSCPQCKAPLISRMYSCEIVEHGGRGFDIEHERVLYECGLELRDGEEASKCGSL